MFLRKLTVILVPLGMLLFLCLVMPLLLSMSSWFFGSLLIGLILGVLLSFLLPLAGATRLREPFAWMLWIPAAVIILILLFQYLATLEPGLAVPVLRLLVVTRESAGYWIVAVEAAFAAYMLSFSIRTGKGI